MQYALLTLHARPFLIDAAELQQLQKGQHLNEESTFEESHVDYQICYGGYLLDPTVSDENIGERLRERASLWLSTLDWRRGMVIPVKLCAISPLEMFKIGHQRVVPFAALIRANDNIIQDVANTATFAVTAFQRIDGWDIANRPGIFALKGIEKRIRETITPDSWLKMVREERAISTARRLIGCNHHR